MFQMMYESSVPGSLAPPLLQHFNQFHLLDGKDMTPEEQTFAHLFWDTKRSGVLFAFMTEADTGDPHVTDQATNGDSATVSVSVTVEPSSATDRRGAVFTFDLRKRGPNWYVYELRIPKLPNGVYDFAKSRT